MEYEKIFTNNSIIVKGLCNILDDEAITYIIKDRVESSRLGGFGAPSNSVEVHVEKNHVARALELAKKYELQINA